MSKRPYFSTRFGKQRASGFETLLESARQNYYRNFQSIWDKLCWKKSVLVRSEVLGMFFNTLTAEFQYSRRNMCNFPQQLQTQLSHRGKAFSGFFIAFPKCTSSLEHLQTGMNFLAKVLPKLLAPQEVVTSMY